MKFIAILGFVLTAFVAGWFAQQHLGSVMGSSEGSGMNDASMDPNEKQPLYWVAPMDPNYRREKPGKSPMGMDLVPVYEESGGQRQDGGVTISQTMEHNLGVRTAMVAEGPFELSVKAVGKIAFNEDRLVHIHSRVEGWIEKTYVKSVGQEVKKGQKLFELYSPQLVNAQQEYIAALRSNNQIMQKASRTRLTSLGFTDNQINWLARQKNVSQRITHYAEQGGVIASLGVRQGMFIKPALEIMTIGPLDEVWLIAEVFERQAGWIKAGQSAAISVPALPGKTRTGVVDYIYPVLDQQTRTLQVRLRFPNDDGLLKPNMFADVNLFASVGDKVISIPREAVIRSGTHDRVVLAEGDGHYRPAFVSLGVESDKKIQILEGLAPGQKVVTSAQFLIDSESKIEVALAALIAQQQTDENSQQVLATGKLDSIKSAEGLLTITHDPIEKWQWPTMKMDFSVVDSVDTDALTVGQRIEFEIEKTGQWDYLITSVRTAASPETSTDSNQSGSTKTVLAQGEIKEVIEDARMLSIVHDPIPEWHWPVMDMMFTVADGQSFDGLKVGQRVSFQLSEQKDGDYVVDNIQPLN